MKHPDKSADREPGSGPEENPEEVTGFLAFCAWLFRWLAVKPTGLYFRTLRHELRRYMRRRPR